jgi:predicted  nucleic acid-binding Zn-ribbon protein
MSLSDDVAELEQDYDHYRDKVRNLEDQLEDVETQLEDATNECDNLLEFKKWVQHVYPEIIRDYESVKVIEEIANEHS